jgi:hypothetical protein
MSLCGTATRFTTRPPRVRAVLLGVGEQSAITVLTANAAAATGNDYMRVEGWGGGNSGLAWITGSGNAWSVSVASGPSNKPIL